MTRCVLHPRSPAAAHGVGASARTLLGRVPRTAGISGNGRPGWSTELLAVAVAQVEEMLQDVPVDGNGNFKYQAFVKQFRSDA